jgi:hypothetical protein
LEGALRFIRQQRKAQVLSTLIDQNRAKNRGDEVAALSAQPPLTVTPAHVVSRVTVVLPVGLPVAGPDKLSVQMKVTTTLWLVHVPVE